MILKFKLLKKSREIVKSRGGDTDNSDRYFIGSLARSWTFCGRIALWVFLLSFILFGKVNLSQAQCPNVGQSHIIGITSGCAPFDFSFDAVFPLLSGTSFPAGVKYELSLDWGDEATSVVATSQTVDALGRPTLTAKPTHTYPQFTDPKQGECVYDVKMRLLVNNVECQDIKTDFTVRVWDTDGYRGGELGINPSPIYICDGNPLDVVFHDISSWNCTGNVGSPNISARTIRWDYGENISGTPIAGVKVERKDASGNVLGLVDMDLNDTIRGRTFKYDDGQFIPDSRGDSWTVKIPATTASDVGKLFWVRLNNWNYCNPYGGAKKPETATARIEIIAVPEPQFVTPIGPFCKGDAAIDLDAYLTSNFFPNQLAFREFTGTGVSYDSKTQKWYFDPAVAGIGSHTIDYREINRGGCEGVDQVVITVTDGSVAKFSVNGKDESLATAKVCGAASVVFQNLSTDGDSYTWDFGDGTIETVPDKQDVTHVFSTTSVPMVVTLTANRSTGCSDTESKTITIFEPVQASFTAKPDYGCGTLDVEFNITSTTSSGSLLKHRFFFDDGTPTVNPTGKIVNHQFLNSGTTDVTYDVRLVSWYSQGGEVACADTTDQDFSPITVYAPPTAGLDQNICYQLTADFDATTSGGTGTWTQVSGPDNAVITNVNDPKSPILAPYPGIYKFKWEVIGGCYGIDTVAVNFVQEPNPNAGLDNSLCDLTYVLRATPLNGIEKGTWSLLSGPGTPVFQNPSANNTRVTVSQEGVYQFRWTVDPGYGCEPRFDDVEISFANPPVQPSYTFTPVSGCSPLTVVFTNTSPAGASNFEWDFGDGITLKTEDRTVTHTFTNATSLPIDFAVHLTSGMNQLCSRVFSDIVTVEPEFSAGYSVTYEGCGPLTRKFENAYPWNFSVRWENENGELLSTDMQPELTFTAVNGQETTYKVYLVGESANGCTDRVENTVIVRVPPVAAFTTQSTNDCAPKLVSFTNTSSLDATSFQWDFGDGSEVTISPNPTHTFVETTGAQGSFNVVLTARNRYGCASTATTTIDVLPTPQADFSVTPQVQTFPDRTVQVTNLTPPGAWTYSWSFGDNTPVETGNVTQHIYTTPGNYTITLTATGTSCSTSRSNGITIYPGAALADFEPDTTGCAPLTVKFRNNSVNGFRYLWDFGNGNHSTDFEPSNIYYNEGTYTVRLETYNHQGEMSSAERTIVVHPKPNAFFRPLPDRVRMPGQSVTFANFSTHADNLLWDFGDGTTSSDDEPVHLYQQTGFYDIQLTVSSIENCADTFLLAQGVEVYSEGELMVPNAFMPSKDGPSGGIYTPGDPHNPVFYPTVVAGDLEKYELQIYNRWGNLLFQSNEPERGWDGYYNDQLCPQDVYVWKIKCRFLNGTEVTKTGDVTLIR